MLPPPAGGRGGFGLRASECAKGYPDSLAKAASCLDADCSGSKKHARDERLLWPLVDHPPRRRGIARLRSLGLWRSAAATNRDRSLAERVSSVTSEVTDSTQVVE